MKESINEFDKLSLFVGFAAGVLAVGLVFLLLVTIHFIRQVRRNTRERSIYLQTTSARQ